VLTVTGVSGSGKALSRKYCSAMQKKLEMQGRKQVSLVR
jgi:adenylylsulfate kinase-like enzyme